MAKESFSNPEVARLLERDYIAVLVDREERPEVDRFYLRTAAAAGWPTGWPLNLWLTPEGKAFHGSSYLPPRGPDGLASRLERAAAAWRTRRRDAEADAEDILSALRASEMLSRARRPSPVLLDAAVSSLSHNFDESHRGFGGAPKFPAPSAVSFLLSRHARTGDVRALAMARGTLEGMLRGELHDSVDGGIHRYAAGADWSRPHREKMLYDNAQFALNLLEAFEVTRDTGIGAAARETLDYMLARLAAPEGVFFCSEYADAAYYAGRSKGERARLAPPRRDDKILVSWNGLAIAALAKGSIVLDEPLYREAALRAAGFIRANLYEPGTGRLSRRWRAGTKGLDGLAEDYALLTDGLLELYGATFDPSWLEWALGLTRVQQSLFFDPVAGGYAASAADSSALLPLALTEDADEAMPAAVSAAALNLLRLAKLTGRRELRAEAEKTLRLYADRLHERPASLTRMLRAQDAAAGGLRLLVVAGEREELGTLRLLAAARSRLRPDLVVLLLDAGSRPALTRRLPFLASARPRRGKPAAYLCGEDSCRLPVYDEGALSRLLDEPAPVRSPQPKKT